jgi:hypothetical protein
MYFIKKDMSRKKSFRIGLFFLIFGFLVLVNSFAQMVGIQSINTSFLGVYNILFYFFGYICILIGVIILGAHFKSWLEHSTGTRL